MSDNGPTDETAQTDIERLTAERDEWMREAMIQTDRAAKALNSFGIQRRLANAVIKLLQDTINELTAVLAVPVQVEPHPALIDGNGNRWSWSPEMGEYVSTADSCGRTLEEIQHYWHPVKIAPPLS